MVRRITVAVLAASLTAYNFGLICRSGEHAAATMIDLGATLITSPTVSHCH